MAGEFLIMTGRRRIGLPPVIAADARVLILGSFPGEASLAAGEYYAHPRNHFWRLLGHLLAEPLADVRYAERLARMQAHGIGLWDSIVSCVRKGSLDTAIRAATRAETAIVRRMAPGVRLVCFNGKTAARAQSAWRDAGYATLALPSSSPAYTLAFAEKLDAWRAIRNAMAAWPETANSREVAHPAPRPASARLPSCA